MSPAPRRALGGAELITGQRVTGNTFAAESRGAREKVTMRAGPIDGEDGSGQ
jgi:hypothetical protein